MKIYALFKNLSLRNQGLPIFKSISFILMYFRNSHNVDKKCVELMKVQILLIFAGFFNEPFPKNNSNNNKNLQKHSFINKKRNPI